MGKFRVGDRVRRVRNGVGWSPIGSVAVVTEVQKGQILYENIDSEGGGGDDPAYFEADPYADQSSARPALLDQFAMAALTGLLRDVAFDDPEIGVAAYSVAQAMMKAREVQK